MIFFDFFDFCIFQGLGEEDYDKRIDRFWPCLKEQACLGAKLAVDSKIRPGTKKYSFIARERPIVDCCSAVDPIVEDKQLCLENPNDFESIMESEKNFPGGFDPTVRGCVVDLSVVDDVEQCHEEAGHRLACNRSQSGRCRLCRACKKGYWPQGVSKCLICPSPLVNAILVGLALVCTILMIMAFLSAALEDTGAEAQSTVTHFSQAQQKIMLNHVQLISLASSFPLKWPEEIQVMFESMSLIGNAGSYMFNPSCSGVEIIEGESMFFQKQLGILMLPFIVLVMCGAFWILVGVYNYINPLHMREKKAKKAKEKKELKRKNKLEKRNTDRREKQHKRKTMQHAVLEEKLLRKQLKSVRGNAPSGNTSVVVAAAGATGAATTPVVQVAEKSADLIQEKKKKEKEIATTNSVPNKTAGAAGAVGAVGAAAKKTELDNKILKPKPSSKGGLIQPVQPVQPVRALPDLLPKPASKVKQPVTKSVVKKETGKKQNQNKNASTTKATELVGKTKEQIKASKLSQPSTKGNVQPVPPVPRKQVSPDLLPKTATKVKQPVQKTMGKEQKQTVGQIKVTKGNVQPVPPVPRKQVSPDLLPKTATKVKQPTLSKRKNAVIPKLGRVKKEKGKGKNATTILKTPNDAKNTIEKEYQSASGRPGGKKSKAVSSVAADADAAATTTTGPALPTKSKPPQLPSKSKSRTSKPATTKTPTNLTPSKITPTPAASPAVPIKSKRLSTNVVQSKVVVPKANIKTVTKNPSPLLPPLLPSKSKRRTSNSKTTPESGETTSTKPTSTAGKSKVNTTTVKTSSRQLKSPATAAAASIQEQKNSIGTTTTTTTVKKQTIKEITGTTTTTTTTTSHFPNPSVPKQLSSGGGIKRRETHTDRLTRLSGKWEHLSKNKNKELGDNLAESTELLNDEIITLVHMMMQPLLSSGVIWMPTVMKVNNSNKKNKKNDMKVKPVLPHHESLESIFNTKIKRLTGRRASQAAVAGYKKGDYLHSIGGVCVKALSYADVKALFKDAQEIGHPYKITVCRKKHGLRDDIQQNAKLHVDENKATIRIWHKFVTTGVTLLYLLYPTLTKATFQLVACQLVGKRYYLQLDLDIPCYEKEHMIWVWRLFMPSLLLYVIGLPLMSLATLYPVRHNLGDRFTRFRFGILFTGYSTDCFYWETVVAARKTAVICVAVFMTPAGAEAQALCCMMIVMFGTVAHLMFRPFEKVTQDHNTLFWSEFWGLQTAVSLRMRCFQCCCFLGGRDCSSFSFRHFANN